MGSLFTRFCMHVDEKCILLNHVVAVADLCKSAALSP